MESLRGRRVMLTGASGSIGGEVARQLANRGAVLVLSGRRKERLESLAHEIAATGSREPVVIAADLGKGGEADSLGDAALQALGGVDVLINNAGASVQGLTWVVGDREEAREVFETNLWSPLALASRLVPRMLEQGGGVIVNVGSMARVSPFPHLGHYAASRAALSSATQVLHLELSARRVRVVEVALGPVDTPASRENRALAGAEQWLDGRPGLGRPEHAAATIVSAAEGGDGVVFYPRVLRWAHTFPGLGLRYTRRTAKHADLEDVSVRFADRPVDAGSRA